MATTITCDRCDRDITVPGRAKHALVYFGDGSWPTSTANGNGLPDPDVRLDLCANCTAGLKLDLNEKLPSSVESR